MIRSTASAAVWWRVTTYWKRTKMSETLGDRLVPVPIDNPGAPAAKVTLSLSRTVNLGDFNSVRAEVGVELPCSATADAIEASHERAVAWCTKKIASLLPAEPPPAARASNGANPFGG